MSKFCPNCSSEIPFIEFVIPKFHFHYVCPACDARLEFGGIFYWGSEILLLIITLSAYLAFNAGWLEFIITSSVAILFFWIQFKFAELYLSKP